MKFILIATLFLLTACSSSFHLRAHVINDMELKIPYLESLNEKPVEQI